jgi:hypothetical protein
MAESTTLSPPPSAAAPRIWSLDRRLAGRLAIGWAGTLAAAHLFRYGLRPPNPLMVGESLAYLGLFIGVLSLAPARAWIDAIPSPHRVVFGGFVVLVAWGQLVVSSRATFPFTAWTMYARAEPRRLVEYYRYRGMDAQGREVYVDPANVFTFVNSAEIASRVKYIGRPATSPEGTKGREEARARVRDLLGALATAYNRSHPDAPLRSLEFMHYAWDYRAQPLAEVVPSPVLEIQIPEGAAR